MNPIRRWWYGGYPTDWTPTITLFRKRSISGETIQSPYCMVRCVDGQLQYREMTAEEEREDMRERAW